MATLRHFSIEVPWGVVHGRTGPCRTGDPIVLLHQTPRSGDEFREVIEAFGAQRQLLAFDLPGMGHSSPHPDGDTVDGYAAAISQTLEAVGIDRCVLVGHHTGAAVAATVAANSPSLVAALILSSPPWIDAEARLMRKAREGPGVDEVERDRDGCHLAALWSGRAGFYPPGRPDLLERFISDALLTADPAAGHRAVTEWRTEDVLPRLQSLKVVVIDNESDPHAHPHIQKWCDGLTDPILISIPNGMVPLEYTAATFTGALRSVLKQLNV